MTEFTSEKMGCVIHFKAIYTETRVQHSVVKDDNDVDEPAPKTPERASDQKAAVSELLPWQGNTSFLFLVSLHGPWALVVAPHLPHAQTQNTMRMLRMLRRPKRSNCSGRTLCIVCCGCCEGRKGRIVLVEHCVLSQCYSYS